MSSAPCPGCGLGSGEGHRGDCESDGRLRGMGMTMPCGPCGDGECLDHVSHRNWRGLKQQLAAAHAERDAARAGLAAAEERAVAWCGKYLARGLALQVARAGLERLAPVVEAARALDATRRGMALRYLPEAEQGLREALDRLGRQEADLRAALLASPEPSAPATLAEAQERYRARMAEATRVFCAEAKAIRERDGGPEDPVKAWDDWHAASKSEPMPAPSSDDRDGCPSCGGAGENPIDDTTCQACGGEGTVPMSQTALLRSLTSAEPHAPVALSCGDCGTMLNMPGESHRCVLPVPTASLERRAAWEAKQEAPVAAPVCEAPCGRCNQTLLGFFMPSRSPFGACSGTGKRAGR